MSMVADIAAFLQTNSLGTVGTTIFYNSMPDAPDSVICLYEYAGEPPLLREALDRPGLQVAVRGTAYETIRATSQAIQNLLMRVGYDLDETYGDGATIGGIQYHRITPAQGVQPAIPDEKGRMVIKQNFNILKRR